MSRPPSPALPPGPGNRLLEAAQAAAGGQQYPQGALYVVATPVGNLADLTLRAIHVLALVDAVACEDTRVGGALLRHLGLSKPLVALHAHNEHAAAAAVVARLAVGARVAYVSDAGTPAISDPGAALVAAVRVAGHRAVPVPGASSVLALLCVAGDVAAAAAGAEPGRDAAPGGFVFLGFAPPKGAARARFVAAAAHEPRMAVLFEAPHRIEALAAALAAQCPGRPVTLGRELTKQFETVAQMPAAELPAWLAAEPVRTRGEFVLALHARAGAPAPADAPLPPAAHTLLAGLLPAMPLRQAVDLATAVLGLPRKALYDAALTLQREGDDPGRNTT